MATYQNANYLHHAQHVMKRSRPAIITFPLKVASTPTPITSRQLRGAWRLRRTTPSGVEPVRVDPVAEQSADKYGYGPAH